MVLLSNSVDLFKRVNFSIFFLVQFIRVGWIGWMLDSGNQFYVVRKVVFDDFKIGFYLNYILKILVCDNIIEIFGMIEFILSFSIVVFLDNKVL